MQTSEKNKVSVSEQLTKYDFEKLPKEFWGYNAIPFVRVFDHTNDEGSVKGYGYAWSSTDYVAYSVRRNQDGEVIEMIGTQSSPIGDIKKRRTQISLQFHPDQTATFKVTEGFNENLKPLKITEEHASRWVSTLLKVIFEYLNSNDDSHPRLNTTSASV